MSPTPAGNADDSGAREALIRGHQNDRVQSLLFPIPIANHTGIEGHVTPLPHVFHAFDKDYVLLIS